METMLEGAGWRQGPICSKNWKLVIRCRGSWIRWPGVEPTPHDQGDQVHSRGPPLALNLALLQALITCWLSHCAGSGLREDGRYSGERVTLCAPTPTWWMSLIFPEHRVPRTQAGSPAVLGGRESLSLYPQMMTLHLLGSRGYINKKGPSQVNPPTWRRIQTQFPFSFGGPLLRSLRTLPPSRKPLTP